MIPPTRPLRVLFAVQGEGRGHMTQALAVADWLRARGHTVSRVLVGQSARRRVPRFVLDGLGAPVAFIPSPNFVAGRNGAIQLGPTVLENTRNWGRYAPALDLVARHVDEAEPDVVVNFYEGMAGLWARRRASGPPVVAVGHQFMFEHPAYRFAPGQRVQRAAARLYTRLAGAGAAVRLALSLYDAPALPEKRVVVVPPLLRRAVGVLGGASHDDGSLLVYLVEPALADGLKRWSAHRPEVPLHCFWDGPAHRHSRSLHFHALDGGAFLGRMARARGVVCTAGFESVSEAMWLGKPVYMVPVEGHFEQRCNALDAEAAGAGLAGARLDLDRFLDWLPSDRPNAAFRAWAGQAEGIVVRAIEEAAGAPLALRRAA